MFLSITMSLLLGLALSPVPVDPVPVDDLQTQSTSTTVQSFTAVEGADLMAKLEAAHARARSRSTPYWSAYTFDVRPGVAIDPAVREFHGNMTTIGDTVLFIGTTPDGVRIDTPLVVHP